MPKHSPSTLIADYVLEQIEHEPISKRIELTLALAAQSPTNAEKHALLVIVHDLRAIERKHRQLVLDFKRRAL